MISKELGTRHRAAVGISERSDAVVVVVSEETGNISVVEAGRIDRYLDSDSFKERLIKDLLANPNQEEEKEVINEEK